MKCRRDHWMTPNAHPQIISFTKEIEVLSIESIKFTYTHVESGFFSDTTRTFDAVKYDDMIFELQYDLKKKIHIGVIEKTSPTQGAYYIDFASEVRESCPPNLGWIEC